MQYYWIKIITYRLRLIPIALLDFYGACISPLFGPTCRFHPTCSAYARLAIQKHGICRGLAKSLVRVAKCHPFHPGGFDPVD